jgi:hypothetical protein
VALDFGYIRLVYLEGRGRPTTGSVHPSSKLLNRSTSSPRTDGPLRRFPYVPGLGIPLLSFVCMFSSWFIFLSAALPARCVSSCGRRFRCSVDCGPIGGGPDSVFLVIFFVGGTSDAAVLVVSVPPSGVAIEVNQQGELPSYFTTINVLLIRICSIQAGCVGCWIR